MGGVIGSPISHIRSILVNMVAKLRFVYTPLIVCHSINKLLSNSFTAKPLWIWASCCGPCQHKILTRLCCNRCGWRSMCPTWPCPEERNGQSSKRGKVCHIICWFNLMIGGLTIYIDMQTWILFYFTRWLAPKMSGSCSHMTSLANGLGTFHKECFSYQTQCSCQIGRSICSGLQFPNFTSRHMVFAAKPTSHSTISSIWPGQMVKTQSDGGLILTQLVWAPRRWALVQG